MPSRVRTVDESSANGSPPGTIVSTPVFSNNDRPVRCDRAFQISNDSDAHRAYISLSPYADRVMRDSPPELERLLPGPNASSSVTLSPAACSACAIHAPNTPAPTTATSMAGRVVSVGFENTAPGTNAAAAMSFVIVLRVVLTKASCALARVNYSDVR